MKRSLLVGAVLAVLACSGSQAPLLAATRQASAPPSNGMIAFTRRTPGRDSSEVLMTINPDGSGKTVIARNAFHPVWSPDGNSLAYEVFPPGQIWVLDAKGTKTRL